MGRERKVSELYVRLSDTLVSGYDGGEFLQVLVDGCKDIFNVDVAGVLLEKREGELALSAASDEEMRTLEAFELQTQDGPCYDAYRSRAQVVVEDLAACEERWPHFVPKALALGFRSGHAFPLRLREDSIGAFNLYGQTPRMLSDADVQLAQSLADIATIGILNERTIRDAQLRAEQLQTALDSRVVIEQAKGVVAAREGISPSDAFERLRSHARRSNAKLSDVCQRVIDEGSLPD